MIDTMHRLGQRMHDVGRQTITQALDRRSIWPALIRCGSDKIPLTNRSRISNTGMVPATKSFFLLSRMTICVTMSHAVQARRDKKNGVFLTSRVATAAVTYNFCCSSLLEAALYLKTRRITQNWLLTKIC